jgi:hypothetical protein
MTSSKAVMGEMKAKFIRSSVKNGKQLWVEQEVPLLVVEGCTKFRS